jgi:hypothetical protein
VKLTLVAGNADWLAFRPQQKSPVETGLARSIAPADAFDEG